MKRSLDVSFGASFTTANPSRIGWVEEPNGRGTLGILIPCISTLLVCSWSVMHLNLPKKSSSTTERLVPYLYWCFIGIFGPELAIWAAWRQLLSARALKTEFETKKLTPYDFSITHGFYAVMGGYVFDFDQSFDPKEPLFATRLSRLTVTPKGVLLLAECGHLPNITKQEIVDKSKVDELGKLVACFQASWMIVQVITRLSLGLPITLLEVMVVGHVMCALVLYSLWWYKPRMIQEPTVLKGAWTRSLAAFMMMSSQLNRGQDSILPGIRVEDTRPEIADLKFFIEPADGCIRIFRKDDWSEDEGDDDRPLYVRSRTGLPSLSGEGITGDFLEDAIIERNEQTRTRWQLACSAIQQYPAIRFLLHRAVSVQDQKYHIALTAYPEMPKKCRRPQDKEAISYEASPWLECETQDFVAKTASDWPHDGLLRTTGGLTMGAILWFASIGFSSIHIAAWNAGFPSEAEAWLWRWSSLYIGFSGLLWAGLHILAELCASLWWLWYDLMIGKASNTLTVLLTLVCSVCGLMYVAARAYLIVESFVELRSLQVGAFVVPQWTLSVPHVG